MTQEQASGAIVAYMTQKKYIVDTTAGQLNIVYLEGLNPDFTLNPDAADGWNDLSLILNHNQDGQPVIVYSATCTTEPGRAATFDADARKVGGVARIAFGQYAAWRMGFHKAARLLDTHPALVQCAPLPVHRDRNFDGKRTGDPMGWASGLNQHGTSANYAGGPVSKWSAGCLVRQWWPDHLKFIELLKTDPRYISNKRFVFSSTIIDGDDFLSKFVSKTT